VAKFYANVGHNALFRGKLRSSRSVLLTRSLPLLAAKVVLAAVPERDRERAASCLPSDMIWNVEERSSTTWALRKAVEAASSTRNLKYVNVSGTSSRYHLIQCSKDAVKDVRRRRSTRTPPTRLVCDLTCNLVRDLPMFTTSGSWTFQATKVRLRTTALLAFLEVSTADHRISLWCMFSSCKTVVM